MGVDLLKHNQEAYEKIAEAIADGKKKIAISHGTGTGKSYLIAKLFEDYSNDMVDEFGSCRWWIGAEFGGSPDALMNLISRFGILPVFHLSDRNEAKGITILRSERIDILFVTDNSNFKERVYL